MALKSENEHAHRGPCAGSNLSAAASPLTPCISAEMLDLPQGNSLPSEHSGLGCRRRM